MDVVIVRNVSTKATDYVSSSVKSGSEAERGSSCCGQGMDGALVGSIFMFLYSVQKMPLLWSTSKASPIPTTILPAKND